LKPFEIGAEKTPQEYVEKIVSVFREVRRVLRDDGVCWLNLGDSYASQGGQGQSRHWDGREKNTETQSIRRGPGGDVKVKDLVGIPWTVALALRADGWWLRADCIWAKGTSGQKALREEVVDAMLEEGVAPEVAARVLARWEPYVGNCMPSSVEDRPTSSHEYVFLLTKSERYFYDIHAVKEEMAGKPHAPGNKQRKAVLDADDARGKNSDPSADPSRTWASSGQRNIRTVWTIPTAPFPGAHFATFGERLVEPMVRSGSSEGGCCASCGAPRERVIEEGEPLADQRAACGADSTGGYLGESTKDHAANGVQDASAVKARILAGMVTKLTVGWRRTCVCQGDEVRPCLVLDPFCGSGTVGAVCAKEGRDFVGIELFAENAEMAKQRIADPDYARKVRAFKRAERVAAIKQTLASDFTRASVVMDI
jgi:hypothetical protein